VATNNETSTILVAFRGSASNRDWFSNLVASDLSPVRPRLSAPGWADTDEADDFKANSGVQEDFQSVVIEELNSCVSAYLSEGFSKVIVTGHSRGGAHATHFTLLLVGNGLVQPPDITLITFNSCRVFNAALAKQFNKHLKMRYTRIVQEGDVVPHLPLKKYGYKH
ncbi:Alpha/Beta hydrolase protein, partial [Tribonema minus]